MALDLGKQVGPLPLGAWIIVVGGGLGIAFYAKRFQGGEPEPIIVEDGSGVPGVGTGGGPAWLPFIPTPPITVTPTGPDEGEGELPPELEPPSWYTDAPDWLKELTEAVDAITNPPVYVPPPQPNTSSSKQYEGESPVDYKKHPQTGSTTVTKRPTRGKLWKSPKGARIPIPTNYDPKDATTWGPGM